MVIISVHFGKSRNPYALPDASPPQGRGRGQLHLLSPLVLLCPTMMILMMRRLLYTTRHPHRRILDSMKSSLILDYVTTPFENDAIFVMDLVLPFLFYPPFFSPFPNTDKWREKDREKERKRERVRDRGKGIRTKLSQERYIGSRLVTNFEENDRRCCAQQSVCDGRFIPVFLPIWVTM